MLEAEHQPAEQTERSAVSFLVRVLIRTKSGVPDALSESLMKDLAQHGFATVTDARIGKLVDLVVDGPDKETVQKDVGRMNDELLVQALTEDAEIVFPEAN